MSSVLSEALLSHVWRAVWRLRDAAPDEARELGSALKALAGDLVTKTAPPNCGNDENARWYACAYGELRGTLMLMGADFGRVKP